ncbi:MAG: BLUF domain-containing protein [Chromatiales bacterium]|nr:BLUF domain-containing protein [Chromatiales bacterium]
MYRLIYKSRIKVTVDWDLITDILHSFEKVNSEHDVNGVLLATNTHFLQVLEGRFEDVNEIFMKTVCDSRHTIIRLISFHVIDARLFSGWGMRGIGVFDFNKNLERQLIEKYGEEEGGIKFPLEEWMVLAMIHDIKMVHDLPSWKV